MLSTVVLLVVVSLGLATGVAGGQGSKDSSDGRQEVLNYQLTLQWPDPANVPGSSYSQTLVYTAVTP